MDLYKIVLFDDGNDTYKQYVNIWKGIINYKYVGKISLQNVKNPEIIINSISEWKCIKLYKELGSSDIVT